MQTVGGWALMLAILAWTVWGIPEYARLKRALADGHRQALRREYVLTIAGTGVLALWAVLVTDGIWSWASDRVGLAEGALPDRGLLSGFLAAVGIGLALPIVLARMGRGTPATAGDSAALLPLTASERRLYVAVALTAGFGEELVYRGFLVAFLAAATPLNGWVVLAVAAVVFGLAHAYQGIAGVLATTVLGGVLLLLFAVSGSLLVPVVVHALIDLRVVAMPTPQASTAGTP